MQSLVQIVPPSVGRHREAALSPGAVASPQALIGSMQAALTPLLASLAGALKQMSEQQGQPNVGLSMLAPPVAMAAPVANRPGQMSPSQAKTLSVLGRHEGVFGKHGTKLDDLRKKANDPNTPPDLRQAINEVFADPALLQRLDSAKNGKGDGKISSKDINVLQSQPEVVELSRQQARAYSANYVSTDKGGVSQAARPINGNDAQRELYKYSDNLPKHIDRQTLQKIVDGTAAMGKCPPQVIASAQHFLDHPAEWQKLAGDDGSISRSKLCNGMASAIRLTAQEDAAVNALKKHGDVFFKGGSLTRDKLVALAQDGSANAEVRQAAQTLLDSPVLYGMLDNGKHGHGGDLWYQADDGKVSKGDVEGWMKHRNPTAAASTSARPASPALNAAVKAAVNANAVGGAQDPSAVSDMLCGQLDQPDIKHAKGGGFRKFLSGMAGGLSKVFEVFAKVADKALGRIPGFGKLLSVPAQIVHTGISGAFNVAKTAIDGGDVKQAAKNMGFDVAEKAVSAPLGLVDPTGVGASLAGRAFRSAIDPNASLLPKGLL